jgi:hypothetical protein
VLHRRCKSSARQEEMRWRFERPQPPSLLSLRRECRLRTARTPPPNLSPECVAIEARVSRDRRLHVDRRVMSASGEDDSQKRITLLSAFRFYTCWHAVSSWFCIVSLPPAYASYVGVRMGRHGSLIALAASERRRIMLQLFQEKPLGKKQRTGHARRRTSGSDVASFSPADGPEIPLIADPRANCSLGPSGRSGAGSPLVGRVKLVPPPRLARLSTSVEHFSLWPAFQSFF